MNDLERDLWRETGFRSVIVLKLPHAHPAALKEQLFLACKNVILRNKSSCLKTCNILIRKSLVPPHNWITYIIRDITTPFATIFLVLKLAEKLIFFKALILYVN